MHQSHLIVMIKLVNYFSQTWQCPIIHAILAMYSFYLIINQSTQTHSNTFILFSSILTKVHNVNLITQFLDC